MGIIRDTWGVGVSDYQQDATPATTPSNDPLSNVFVRIFNSGSDLLGGWVDSQVGKWTSEQKIKDSEEPATAASGTVDKLLASPLVIVGGIVAIIAVAFLAFRK